MKVKLKLVALNQAPKLKDVNGKKEVEMDKDGNIIYDEPTEVKDAIQLKRLDGSYLALGEFGKNISNGLISTRMPESVKDLQGFLKDMELMYNSKGEEFEINEEYIPVIKERVKQNESALVCAYVEKFLDLAVLEAKRKENDKKIKELKKK